MSRGVVWTPPTSWGSRAADRVAVGLWAQPSLRAVPGRCRVRRGPSEALPGPGSQRQSLSSLQSGPPAPSDILDHTPVSLSRPSGAERPHACRLCVILMMPGRKSSAFEGQALRAPALAILTRRPVSPPKSNSSSLRPVRGGWVVSGTGRSPSSGVIVLIPGSRAAAPEVPSQPDGPDRDGRPVAGSGSGEEGRVPRRFRCFR